MQLIFMPCASAIIIAVAMMYVSNTKKQTCAANNNCTTWNRTYLATFIIALVCAASVLLASGFVNNHSSNNY